MNNPCVNTELVRIVPPHRNSVEKNDTRSTPMLDLIPSGAAIEGITQLTKGLSPSCFIASNFVTLLDTSPLIGATRVDEGCSTNGHVIVQAYIKNSSETPIFTL